MLLLSSQSGGGSLARAVSASQEKVWPARCLYLHTQCDQIYHRTNTNQHPHRPTTATPTHRESCTRQIVSAINTIETECESLVKVDYLDLVSLCVAVADSIIII